jgi:hypothetical protein
LKLAPQLLAGVLVFLAAFGLFATTTSSLTGYEDETAAVTEGLVLNGQFYETEAAEGGAQGIRGKGGHLYARTGLLQPLLEAPFYAAGHIADLHFFEPKVERPFRETFLWFYNPFIAALAAVAMFALIFVTRRSLGWAATIAGLFIAASIAWPYSKIGMDTTFMFAILAAFALGAWARTRHTPLVWTLTGFAIGAAAATKAYAVLTLLALAVLLWPTFATLDRQLKLRLGAALMTPVIAWGVAIAWYNVARFGSPTDFGYSEAALTLSMPFNFLGLLFSPGKGLVFYSPLVVIGALGMPRLWRVDRSLAAALLILLLTLTGVSGASSYWGDEVWGPRYIVPAAWTMLVPIAWWADSRPRRRILAGVATIAMVVQVIAVSAPYSSYIGAVRALTGVEVYGTRFGENGQLIPYGDDPPRWIPELSAIIVQAEELISSQIIEPLGGDGLKVTYRPFEGRNRTVNMSAPGLRQSLNFWWNGASLPRQLASLLMFIVGLASAVGLFAISTRRWTPPFVSRGPWDR